MRIVERRARTCGRIAFVIVCLAAISGCGGSKLRVVNDAPRLIFRPATANAGVTFDSARKKAKVDSFASDAIAAWLIDQKLKAKEYPGPAAMRWILSQKDEDAKHAVARLTNEVFLHSNPKFRDGLGIALAYDWLGSAGLLDKDLCLKIEERITKHLENTLKRLRRPGPSMWHRWTKNSNTSMLLALALRLHPKADEYRTRMLPLYREGLEALQLSEAWPGGYPYWLGNRATPFALAALGYHSSTGKWTIGDLDIRNVLKRTGRWHMYALRPDNTFLRYGDTFYGVQPDYWQQQPPHDLFATVTGDPYLAAFADHFRDFKAKGHPYRPSFAWLIPFAYPTDLPRPPEYSKQRKLECLQALPQSDRFGKDATGLVVLRKGGWTPDATVISFRAGHAMAHHGHWDAGNFTIFKHEPLAILSGVYGHYTSDSRLGYYIRSIAANTLLIRKPGERLTGKFNDGGQRTVMTVASTVSSLKQWRRRSRVGGDWHCGVVESFASEKQIFDYVAADLTSAYNSTIFCARSQTPKVSSVTRQMIYIREADTLLIVDRIEKTDAAYRSQWLLHCHRKPKTGQEKLLAGTADNGILESKNSRAFIVNGKGRLVLDRLCPREHRWRKLGGPDYCSFVENDGNDRNAFAGTNLISGLSKDEYQQIKNQWRIELEPTVAQKVDHFAVAIHVGSNDQPLPKATHPISGTPPGILGVHIGSELIFVADHSLRIADSTLHLPSDSKAKHILLAGFKAGTKVKLSIDGKSIKIRIPTERVCRTSMIQLRKGN